MPPLEKAYTFRDLQREKKVESCASRVWRKEKRGFILYGAFLSGKG